MKRVEQLTEKQQRQIAYIEEEIKDMEYRLRDAQWTMNNLPHLIEMLKSTVKVLEGENDSK